MKKIRFPAWFWVCLLATGVSQSVGQQAGPERSDQAPRVIVDSGHRWRPPYGLDRVGAPLQAHVELAALPDAGSTCVILAHKDGREVESHALAFTSEKPPFWSTVRLETVPDEVSVAFTDVAGGKVEVLRQRVTVPDLQADAVARPDQRINPVDLGAILVPQDWLLLAEGQRTTVEVAAICHSRSVSAGRLKAWFGDGEPVECEFPLQAGRRATQTLQLPFRALKKADVLYVALVDGSRVLWKKEIHVMSVLERPQWPAFGAVETKLRYDAPISVIDSASGADLPALDYEKAWDPKLNDVVVLLPNGSRFVFWRGTNYVPFWAGSHNTGVCYQWAENLSVPIVHADGTRDFPEPLYDFELRYGHVQIIESTRSRIHVRWTYQATDIDYRVWGDLTREDFFFYPDGFGTRVLTIASKPGSRYQMSEFLILTPQSAFPLDVLPGHAADVLFLDGQKAAVHFPFEPTLDPKTGKRRKAWPESREQPALFRIFAHKDDRAAAVYFYPGDRLLPLFSFGPLHDRGEIVTPFYWGSHWPLARGKVTAYSIDDRIYRSPAHNSLGGWLPQTDGRGGWGYWEVPSIESARRTMPNAKGNAVEMDLNVWSWLIAKNDASDEVLLQWAKSYSAPPSLEVSGAELALPSYSPERRAIRLVAESTVIGLRILPDSWTMNPVFELAKARGDLQEVALDGRTLPPNAYSWDGATLWVNAVISAAGARLELRFGAREEKPK